MVWLNVSFATADGVSDSKIFESVGLLKNIWLWLMIITDFNDYYFAYVVSLMRAQNGQRITIYMIKFMWAYTVKYYAVHWKIMRVYWFTFLRF